MTILGLDIGSNSVGSAWVDTAKKEIELAVSVFPAGVDEQEDKRGAPMNQARRQVRQQRRNIDRRTKRKRQLTRFLMEHGLLPRDAENLRKLYDLDPWQLRRKALKEPLTPHEYGRVLVHLAQRRGAVGVTTDPDDPEEGKVKEGMDRLNAELKGRGVETIGQLMADLIEERKQVDKSTNVAWHEPIRNRQYRMPEEQQFFAARELIRDEYRRIVEAQRSYNASQLATMLSDDVIKRLDDSRQTDTWRHGGLLFGQRRTYWDTGTLGRCDLEPTERCAPIADRHASYFRVVETVNNIKIEKRGELRRPLMAEERAKVIALLRGPLFKKSKGNIEPKSSASVTDIKHALGIAPRDKAVKLNLEADEDREINTDWFYRDIVHGSVGEERWKKMEERARESVNRAILNFDPDQSDDASKLHAGAKRWWGLDDAAATRLVEAWKRRPKLEKRLNLSRRAILTLLPIMEQFDNDAWRWPTQQEARKAFARTLSDTHRRRRYETGAPGLTAADRYYMRLEKHQIGDGLPELPPAPTLSNPVVRKAIHEVRRHVMAYLREFHRKPDRVLIEMARITKQSERQRNAALARNRQREKIRKGIIDEILPAAFGKEAASKLNLNQQRAAIDRVILTRQQTQVCPSCGKAGLTDRLAAKGDDLDIDHIVPYSRCGDNGLNNKVLVHRTCNRGKGNLTAREWWGSSFDERIAVAEKLFKGIEPEKSDYFRRQDFERKWQNFNREVREDQEWKNSQLTDTAYAARQVAAYLADALFDGKGLPERGDRESNQKIFFTMGRFTAMLRKDWQLFETVKPLDRDGGLAAEQELQLAEKDRGDHRQHAIDAVTIALTEPAIKNKLAGWAAAAAEYFEKTGKRRARPLVEPPWGDVSGFRKQVLSSIYERLDGNSALDAPKRLIVAHRPVKRRLVGAFHEDTHYGPVIGPLPSHRTEKPSVLFTNRISAERLTPNHLRVADGWEALSNQLDNASLSNSEKVCIRRQLAALKDPSPGKSGIVRDRALRDRIRKCLRANGLDPSDFTANEVRQLVRDGRLKMASGVPIKGVVLLRTNTDPVIILRKRWDPATNKLVIDDDQRTARVYIGGNNHHIEIRESPKTGWWVGEIVPTFDAAKRVRSQKLPAIDRSDNAAGRFMMSLAEGEMVFARRKDRPEETPNYFVVCKLDKPARIHFAPHWDARKAGDQDRWDATPGDLKECGPEPGSPIVKVRVSPLGEVQELVRD